MNQEQREHFDVLIGEHDEEGHPTQSKWNPDTWGTSVEAQLALRGASAKASVL